MRGQTDEFFWDFCIRKNGERPAAQVKMVTSYRATLPDNSEAAYWPIQEESAFNEISNYEWDYQLAPLVIEVPKGNHQPFQIGRCDCQPAPRCDHRSLAKQDIKEKAIAYVGKWSLFLAASRKMLMD